jgi:hypothetical protein
VGHWTLDNASVNDTFMKELGVLLQARGIAFDSDDNRIMCFPHIINICVTHVIKSFTDIDLVDDEAVFNMEPPPSNPAEQTYDEAVEHNPIALCHSSVQVIRVSGT